MVTPKKRSTRKVSESRANGAEEQDKIVQLAPDSIVLMNPYQPRDAIEEDDDLHEMASSIRERGRLVQPIIVRPVRGRNRFQLVAGERRFKAAVLAGLDTVSAIVRKLSDQEMAEEALIENLHRKDLRPPEEGKAVQMALDLGLTFEDLVKKTGRSEPHLRTRLRIYKELSADVKQMLCNDELKVSHAEVLLDIESRKDQKEAADMAVKQNLTAKQLKARTQHKSRKTTRHQSGKSERGYGHQELSRDILDMYTLLGKFQLDTELPQQKRASVAKQVGFLITALQKIQKQLS